MIEKSDDPKKQLVMNYQDSVTAPLAREHDAEAAPEEDESESIPGDVIPAVAKVSYRSCT